MIQKSLVTLLASSALVLGVSAFAQSAANYPSKPLKIVVPFPAGGTSDVLARIFGQKITEHWGQPVVVENRPGAGGNIGADIDHCAPLGKTRAQLVVLG